MMPFRIVAASLSLFLVLIIAASSAAPAQNRADPRNSSPHSAADPTAATLSDADSGSIRGTVHSFDGRPVANASIQVREIQRGKQFAATLTDSQGYFALYNIPPGTYEVSANSGSNLSTERVEVSSAMGGTSVDLRLNDKPVDDLKTGNSSTVSFSQYRVPAKARAQYEKAVQALNRRQLDETRKKVDAALAIYPQFAEALTLRAMLQEDAGKKEEAEADYLQAIQYDPNYPVSYIALGSLFNSTRRFKEALPILNEAERLSPNTWQIYFELSRSHIAMHDYAEAVRNADRATELEGGPAKAVSEVHLVRGYALAGLHRVPEAIQEIEIFLANEPPGPHASRARQVLNELQGSEASASK